MRLGHRVPRRQLNMQGGDAAAAGQHGEHIRSHPSSPRGPGSRLPPTGTCRPQSPTKIQGSTADATMTWGWHGGPAGKGSAHRACIPWRCQLNSWLLHFQSNNLLMCPGWGERMAKCWDPKSVQHPRREQLAPAWAATCGVHRWMEDLSQVLPALSCSLCNPFR